MIKIFWFIPACAILALIFAYIFFKGMMKNSEGNDTMKKIAKYVKEGAMAYLTRQYKVVGLIFLCLFI